VPAEHLKQLLEFLASAAVPYVPGPHFWHLVSRNIEHGRFSYSPGEQKLQPEHCVSIEELQPYFTKLVLLQAEQALHISEPAMPNPV
jgi:hypothetical protein